ncbi:efflux RND transporter permease subunit [Spongiibacter taiwanensis]|uniref:efflux RND transporter permease subunit n=1 Tax=Spongiibacter taiwanensis TaxID=1748242 RepID=UPI002035489B|nr:efflux RND transporter permease subunit [Spongiibacter taiwanensis]USA44120.1 efflux RND transporter permease subunit [Spongiibacter taiwanensis]
MIPAEEANTHQGVIAWFARNSVAANLLMFAILSLGIGSAFTIQKALQPDFEINAVQVTVVYPGANPEEVERGVVLKIEEALADIDAIDTIEATADESLATFKIDILEDNDINVVIDEIKSAIDGIISFPAEIERPVVKQVEFDTHAIILQLYGDLDERGLKLLADQLKQELLQLEHIANVKINGARDFEIAIEIPEHQLMKYQLTLSKVADIIAASSLDVPGGAIKTASGNILLRTRAQARQQQEFENLTLISYPDGTRLTLGDIAIIRDAFVEEDSFSYFNGKPSVGLQIFAVGKQDLLEVSRTAKEFVARQQPLLPKGVRLDYWADITFYLESRLDMMLKNLSAGALLVFVVLSLFLNIKLAFWVMLGLPVSFFGAFALMPVFDVSLNMLSLFGFILVLGIVVDDAIIIGESAHSECQRLGHSTDSVIRGAMRVATPATFGVLTTIMAFSPTLFSSGAFAPFPEAIGWVVILCLVFSMLESKWILPAHLTHMKPARHPLLIRLDRLPAYSNAWLERIVQERYLPLINRAISLRYVTAALFTATLIITAGLVASGIVRFVIIPEVPSDFLQAKLEMVEGSAESQTRAGYEKINQALLAVDQQYQDEHGNDSAKHLIKHVSAYGTGGRSVTFMAELSKSESRDIDGNEIARRWRQAIGEIPGARVLSVSSADQTAGPAVSLKLSSSNPQQLAVAGERIEEALSHFKGVYDIRNSASTLRDEMVLEIKPSAENLGLSAAQLGRQVRDAFYGAEAQRVQRGNDEVKVMVRYPQEERKAVADLQNMYIHNGGDTFIPLTAVAEVSSQPSPSKLTRIDGERAINITAEVDKQITEPTEVTGAVIAEMSEELKRVAPSVSIALSGESEEASELFTSLLQGMIIALLGIFILLAVPLRSYLQPLIIMGVIPFGIIGAILGHLVLGMPFSMMSFFGIIALAGVVVNDSLIMVDFVNSAIARGETLREAVVNAGGQRFRAILLTSLTTFFGLLPILLETSLQAQFVIPMAVSLAFGIVFATVITLILIPCAYVMLDDFKRLARRRDNQAH